MIAVIKYNAGNIQSVQNALYRPGCKSKVTDNSREIISADKVIIPGVGEADSILKGLHRPKLKYFKTSLNYENNNCPGYNRGTLCKADKRQLFHKEDL